MRKQFLVTVEFDGPEDSVPAALAEGVSRQLCHTNTWEFVGGERWYWAVTGVEPVEDTRDEGEE